MDAADGAGLPVSKIAAAIGEPARVRMLYCLMDGRARTATELAAAAGVTPSTASLHLKRLKTARLVEAVAQGRHRFYSLENADVARVLEGLRIVAGHRRDRFASRAPDRLRAARTCYDHLAGTVGVALHDRLKALRWLSHPSAGQEYDVTPSGEKGLGAIGVDVAAARALRRRFAYGCLDWSERRFHLGGALAAALLEAALRRRWVIPDLDSRALSVTGRGRREIETRFGLRIGRSSPVGPAVLL